MSNVKRRNLIVLCGVALLMMSSVYFSILAQAPAPAAAAPTAGAPATTEAPLKVEQTVTLWSLIKSGGWAMYPLGTCSIAVVWLTVLNFMRVNKKKLLPLELVGQIKAAAAQRDLPQMLSLAQSSDSLFTKALAAGLVQIQPDNPEASRHKVEQVIGEVAGREESRYGFYVNFLSLLTSMSPMWGLIGTVSGMIGAFSKIGQGGMGKPEMLAKNIGEALVCTATGLIIAITAMLFYFVFRNILNTVMKESEGQFTEILDNLIGGPVTQPVTQYVEATEGEPAAKQQ